MESEEDNYFVDILMEDNPDLDRKQACEFWRQICDRGDTGDYDSMISIMRASREYRREAGSE